MDEKKPYISEVITDPEILKTKPNTDCISEEIPVRVEVHGNEAHKTETRIFRRDIHESYCAQPDCEFFGKHTSQGNCYSSTDDDGSEAWFNRYERRTEALEKELVEMRNECKTPEEYLDYLEGSWVYDKMCWDNTLDECIQLRAENARLKNKLGEWK